MRDLVFVTCAAFVLTLFTASSLQLSMAETMGSSNYQIQSDSLNVGGGYSSSGSYQLESTAGEVATGLTSSDSFRVYAGFQQTQGSYIALSTSGDVTLSPTLQGVSGGYASGTASANVVTDSPGGYSMTIQAENSPAMQSDTHTIADYASDTADPDYSFSVTASEAELGFSPEGADIVERYLDLGGSCNQSGGSDTSDTCWDGLSTTPTTIALGSGSNHPSGTDTTIVFQLGIGASVNQAPGMYVATSTITVTAL